MPPAWFFETGGKARYTRYMRKLKNLLLIAFCLCLLLVPVYSVYSEEIQEAPTIKAEAEDVVAAPKADKGKATKVQVHFALLDISNINDKDQRLAIDLALRLTWKDLRLAEKVSKDEMRAKVEDVWTPNIQILNDVGLQKKMDDVVDIEPDGTVTYRQRYVGDIAQKFNLKEFPRDKHRFVIRVGSAGEKEGMVEFEAGSLYFPDNEDVTVEDWWFRSGTLDTSPLYFKGFNEGVPGFTYAFHGTRRIGFYIWTLIVPLSVIVFMSWSVFWLDPQPELFGPQAGIATTSMLTVVAFRFILVNFMPNVSYMTRMDKFLLGALVLVFLSLVEVILTSDLAKRGNMKAAKRVDFYSRFVFPLAFGLMIFISFVS